jgi:hypothetical protein
MSDSVSVKQDDSRKNGVRSRLSLVKPSTRALWREGRKTPGYTFWDWVHGYVYARWPYLYIGTALEERRLSGVVRLIARAWSFFEPRNGSSGTRTTAADGYHGKVLPLEEATRLITVNEPIVVEDLEQVIPYTEARSIILRNPDSIAVLDCPCRVSRPDPCLPLSVCLIVGEPFTSFILEHHPGRSRRIDQEEAATILQEERRKRRPSYKKSTIGAMSTMPSSKTPCWTAIMLSATVAPAVVGRCRCGAASRLCWPLPATWSR